MCAEQCYGQQCLLSSLYFVDARIKSYALQPCARDAFIERHHDLQLGHNRALRAQGFRPSQGYLDASVDMLKSCRGNGRSDGYPRRQVISTAEYLYRCNWPRILQSQHDRTNCCRPDDLIGRRK